MDTERVYLLLRTGTWGEDEFRDWMSQAISDAYQEGLNAMGSRYTAEQLREAEVRGWNQGFSAAQRREDLYDDDTE